MFLKFTSLPEYLAKQSILKLKKIIINGPESFLPRIASNGGMGKITAPILITACSPAERRINVYNKTRSHIYTGRAGGGGVREGHNMTYMN